MPNHSHAVSLNRFERQFLAIHDAMGGMIQTYVLAFDVPVEPQAMRHAFRALVSAFPRLRCTLQPAWWTWRLQVLDDDWLVDQLAEDAFRVQPGVDAGSRGQVQALHQQLINDGTPTARGIPVRGVFLPHPQRPVFLFSVHHLVGDGRSMMQMVAALMRLLNGQAVAPVPVDRPGAFASILPQSPRDWLPSLWASWRHARAHRRELSALHAVRLQARQARRFSTIGVRHYDLPCPASAFRAVAKRLGTSVNTLFNAALAEAMLMHAGSRSDAAVLRIAVDLRRYFPEGRAPVFGNFVTTFLIAAPAGQDLPTRVASLDEQVRRWLGRLERHEMGLAHLLAEAQALIGRKLYLSMLNALRRRDALPRQSAQTSNIGNADRQANEPDARIRLVELRPSVSNLTPMFPIAEIGDSLQLGITWLRDDTDDEQMDALLARLDAVVLRWVGQAQQEPGEAGERTERAERPVSA